MSDLREALEAAITSESATSAETPSTPVAESAPATTTVAESAPASDAPVAQTDDTPAAKSEENATPSTDTERTPESAKPKSIEEVVDKAADEGEQRPDEKRPEARIDRAPASWKGDAKKLWDAIPLQARQEVVRREKQVAQTLNEIAEERKHFQQFDNVLAPHMDRINVMYKGNSLQAINNLMHVERILTSAPPKDKAVFVARMIKQFNIDVNELDDALSGQMTPEAKQADQLATIIDQKLAPIQQMLSRVQQPQQPQPDFQTEADMTVAQMAEDSDNFPYFQDVREDMADLIEISAKRGLSLSMEQAYTKAVAMNDRIQQSSNVRTQSQAATQAALAAHQAAQKAKGAAVSVSGAPTGTGVNAGNPGDLRGTIASAIDGFGGRV